MKKKKRICPLEAYVFVPILMSSTFCTGPSKMQPTKNGPNLRIGLIRSSLDYIFGLDKPADRNLVDAISDGFYVITRHKSKSSAFSEETRLIYLGASSSIREIFSYITYILDTAVGSGSSFKVVLWQCCLRGEAGQLLFLKRKKPNKLYSEMFIVVLTIYRLNDESMLRMYSLQCHCRTCECN